MTTLDASRCSWRLHLWSCQSFLVVSVADVVVAAVVAARRTLELFDPSPSHSPPPPVRDGKDVTKPP